MDQFSNIGLEFGRLGSDGLCGVSSFFHEMIWFPSYLLLASLVVILIWIFCPL